MLATTAVMLGASGSPGCADETAFDDTARALLEAYRLPPAPPPDPSNAFADDARAAVVGKRWFFDRRFSGALGAANADADRGALGAPGDVGKVACVSCHDLSLGGSDHRTRPAATSLAAGYDSRNAITVMSSAYTDPARGGWLLWDGHKDSQWSLALGPLENPLEHNASRLQVAHVIFDHYRASYETIFGALPALGDLGRFPRAGKPGEPSYDLMPAADRAAIDRVFANVGKALAAYERRLVSTSFAPSPFDRALAGDASAMTPAAVRGARLFVGKAACDECHRGYAFSDGGFHNIGVPQEGDHAPQRDVGRFASTSILDDPFNRAGELSDRRDDSRLRDLATTDRDVGAFKTPTLRNVSKTAPYMHDGVYGTLSEVVDHYNAGGKTGEYAGTREVTIEPLLLDAREVGDLVEFLRSLDDGGPLASADFPEGLTSPPLLPD
ncbi:MAG: cytochrome c peroxidase [Kofleriaceae bacterium]